MKNKEIIKNIIIILLIIGILVFGYLYFEKPKIIYQDKLVEDNRAILDVDIYTFAQNLYDSSEMFYDYSVFNYGNGEAKNIIVTCKSWDENMILKFSLTDSFGNLASKSLDVGEVTGKNKLIIGEEYISDCYISSCDNCKVLYKEIPELVKYFEEG